MIQQAYALKYSAVLAILIVVSFAGSGDRKILASMLMAAIGLLMAGAVVGASDTPRDKGLWVLLAALVPLVWVRVFMRDAVSDALAQTPTDRPDDKKRLP